MLECNVTIYFLVNGFKTIINFMFNTAHRYYVIASSCTTHYSTNVTGSALRATRPPKTYSELSYIHTMCLLTLSKNCCTLTYIF
jgi:hypothetical protein